MMEKPVLGVAPYYIPAEARITALAQAIIRYADAGCGNRTGNIAKWAREIIEQCRLIDAMIETEHESLSGLLKTVKY